MNTIYIKSDKAVKEFEQGTRTLSLRHRQLLIMVNGKRTCRQIASMFNSDHAIQMLTDLEKLGYVLSANATEKQAMPAEKMGSPSDSLSQEHLIFIKTFLIEEARLQLGLMSREIEQKIALVQNSDDLKSSIARWHMAIRDSRNGRTVADKLMERLAHLLVNPPRLMAYESAS